MNIFNIKTVAALAIALTGLLGSSIAQAGPDVRWSVTIGGPAQYYGQQYDDQQYDGQQYYRQPEPVYYAPVPVYIQPRPVYRQVQPHYHSLPVDYGYPTRWDRDADGIRDRYERQHSRRGDLDRDGVPDRYDRRPGDSWRH